MCQSYCQPKFRKFITKLKFHMLRIQCNSFQKSWFICVWLASRLFYFRYIPLSNRSHYRPKSLNYIAKYRFHVLQIQYDIFHNSKFLISVCLTSYLFYFLSIPPCTTSKTYQQPKFTKLQFRILRIWHDTFRSLNTIFLMSVCLALYPFYLDKIPPLKQDLPATKRQITLHVTQNN